MHEGLDVVIQRGFLEMVGDRDGLETVKFDILKKILAMNEVEAQLGNSLI